MKACKYGDCADHYGDSAAWCDKCKAAQQQEHPDGAAAAGAGLVADLLRISAECRMKGFAVSPETYRSAAEIAKPFDAELIRLRAKVAELEATIVRLTDDLESAEARGGQDWRV